MKIKKGDTVVVIAGKDKGAKGKVIVPTRGRTSSWSKASPRQEARTHPHLAAWFEEPAAS